MPHDRWKSIDEISVPFAGSLPENADVILGLEVSRRNAPWDPKYVLQNVRYLLGRYFQRAVLFEAAADYCHAIILDDLKEALLNTDMASFPRRKLLLGERAFSFPPSRGGGAS